MALADADQAEKSKPAATVAELHHEIRVLRHRVERVEGTAKPIPECDVLPEWQQRLVALQASQPPHESSAHKLLLAARQRVLAMSPIRFHLQVLLLRFAQAVTRSAHSLAKRPCHTPPAQRQDIPAQL